MSGSFLLVRGNLKKRGGNKRSSTLSTLIMKIIMLKQYIMGFLSLYLVSGHVSVAHVTTEGHVVMVLHQVIIPASAKCPSAHLLTITVVSVGEMLIDL